MIEFVHGVRSRIYQKFCRIVFSKRLMRLAGNGCGKWVIVADVIAVKTDHVFEHPNRPLLLHIRNDKGNGFIRANRNLRAGSVAVFVKREAAKIVSLRNHDFLNRVGPRREVGIRGR